MVSDNDSPGDGSSELIQYESPIKKYLHSLLSQPEYLPEGFTRRIVIPVFFLYLLGLAVNIYHAQWHYVGPIACILAFSLFAYRNSKNPKHYWQIQIAIVVLPTLIAISMWSESPNLAMAWGMALPIFFYAIIQYQRAAELLVVLIAIQAILAFPHEGELGTIRYIFWMIIVSICLYHFTDSIYVRYKEILRLSTTDDLTQLLNRRALNERLREWGLFKMRYPDVSVSLAILDIDLFKNINDQWGHPTGDDVLKFFAKAVKRRIRANDIVARQGGEEFAILFPHTSLTEARRVLEDVREFLQLEAAPHNIPVTFSGGLAEIQPNEAVDDWWLRADKALYQSKAKGRNCDSEG